MADRMWLQVVCLVILVIGSSSCIVSGTDPDIAQLTKENIDEFLAIGGVVAVKFYNPTCPLCRLFEPKWVKLSKQLKKKGMPVRFAEVDVKNERSLAKLYEISLIPTIYVFYQEFMFEYLGSLNNINTVRLFLEGGWTKVTPMYNPKPMTKAPAPPPTESPTPLLQHSEILHEQVHEPASNVLIESKTQRSIEHPLTAAGQLAIVSFAMFIALLAVVRMSTAIRLSFAAVKAS